MNYEIVDEKAVPKVARHRYGALKAALGSLGSGKSIKISVDEFGNTKTPARLKATALVQGTFGAGQFRVSSDEKFIYISRINGSEVAK